MYLALESNLTRSTSTHRIDVRGFPLSIAILEIMSLSMDTAGHNKNISIVYKWKFVSKCSNKNKKKYLKVYFFRVIK